MTPNPTHRKEGCTIDKTLLSRGLNNTPRRTMAHCNRQGLTPLNTRLLGTSPLLNHREAGPADVINVVIPLVPYKIVFGFSNRPCFDFK
ncbi:hypothetical protein JCGZ_01520 [Jatropha curcas]|uniref:Uncharacterized protein n=1 Tax=Jatropha curcas TaxID=180498 RepID=A0A067LK07_JATCU|nr:hypothetical protein JCGZ_01520 [Jatropha curcas]